MTGYQTHTSLTKPPPELELNALNRLAMTHHKQAYHPMTRCTSFLTYLLDAAELEFAIAAPAMALLKVVRALRKF